MNHNFKTPSSRGKRRGVTLIEAIAGMVILGTLVASVALARGRAVQQYARADLQLNATRAADTLLARWLAGPQTEIPIGGTGAMPGMASCRWRTRRLNNPAAQRLGAIVVRLEVFAISDAQQSDALVGIEFLVPEK